MFFSGSGARRLRERADNLNHLKRVLLTIIESKYIKKFVLSSSGKKGRGQFKTVYDHRFPRNLMRDLEALVRKYRPDLDEYLKDDLDKLTITIYKILDGATDKATAHEFVERASNIINTFPFMVMCDIKSAS